MNARRPTAHSACTLILCFTAGLLLASCAKPIKPHSEPESYALVNPVKADAWKALTEGLPDDGTSSWFAILDKGSDALRWRLALIDTARTSIDTQYFLWKDDAVGSLLLERLLLAADRGVRVRFLIDDSFLSGEDLEMLEIDTHPNIEIRVFNPFQIRSSSALVRYLDNLNDFGRTNHRMHNKLLMADSEAAIVGGRNIADEYFGFGKQQNFRDFDLIATGKVISGLAAGFDTYWNSGWAFPVTEVDGNKVNDGDLTDLRAELRETAVGLGAWLTETGVEPRDWSAEWRKLGGMMLPGEAEILQDKPHFEGDTPPVQVADRIRLAFEESDTEIVGITAYLIPTDELLTSIAQANATGVRIRMLTNSLASTNHVPAHTAYRHQREAMLAAGVELHEVRLDGLDRADYEAPGFIARRFGLHGKVVIFDDNRVFIGTLNLDPRSMVLNTEMGLLIDSPALNEAVRDALAPNFSLANSWRVEKNESGELIWRSHDGVLTRQPADGMSRRIRDFFYGLMPIDSEM